MSADYTPGNLIFAQDEDPAISKDLVIIFCGYVELTRIKRVKEAWNYSTIWFYCSLDASFQNQFLPSEWDRRGNPGKYAQPFLKSAHPIYI